MSRRSHGPPVLDEVHLSEPSSGGGLGLPEEGHGHRRMRRQRPERLDKDLIKGSSGGYGGIEEIRIEDDPSGLWQAMGVGGDFQRQESSFGMQASRIHGQSAATPLKETLHDVLRDVEAVSRELQKSQERCQRERAEVENKRQELMLWLAEAERMRAESSGPCGGCCCPCLRSPAPLPTPPEWIIPDDASRLGPDWGV